MAKPAHCLCCCCGCTAISAGSAVQPRPPSRSPVSQVDPKDGCSQSVSLASRAPPASPRSSLSRSHGSVSEALRKALADIRHVHTPRAGPAAAVIAEAVGESEERLRWLIDFGAVWHLGKKRLAAADWDRELPAGDYVRVHLEPKRFPVEGVDWRAAIVHCEEEFVVVNKPPGVPVHANSDNARENVVEQVAAVVGGPVFVTSRLDQPTRGLLVLARSNEFLSRFNLILRKHKIRKRYRVLAVRGRRRADPPLEGEGEVGPEGPAPEAEPSEGPAPDAGSFEGPAPEAGPPEGPLVHHMEDGPRAPRRVARAARPGWLECRLTVLAARRVAPGEVAPHWGAAAAEAAAAWAAAAEEPALYDVEVELGTGRTHQIRAQLAHEGFPVFGDATYGFRGGTAPGPPFFGLQCSGLRFKRPGRPPVGGELLDFVAPDPPDA